MQTALLSPHGIGQKYAKKHCRQISLNSFRTVCLKKKKHRRSLNARHYNTVKFHDTHISNNKWYAMMCLSLSILLKGLKRQKQGMHFWYILGIDGPVPRCTHFTVWNDSVVILAKVCSVPLPVRANIISLISNVAITLQEIDISTPMTQHRICTRNAFPVAA